MHPAISGACFSQAWCVSSCISPRVPLGKRGPSATTVAVDFIFIELGAEQHPLFFLVYKEKFKRYSKSKGLGAGLSACVSRSLVQGRVDGRAVCGLTSCLVLPGHMNWGESAVPDSTPGPLLRPLDSPFPPSWLWSTTRACPSGCRSVVMEHLGSVVSPFTLP